jgi:cupin superfamily acireductone dioxygenase involved in methionine salvage
MENYLERLGNWPENISESVKKKEIRVISEEDTIGFIHGKHNQNKISFYLSNDMVHVGKLILTKGKFTDIESHRGDEALWVLEGNIQIKVWKGDGTQDTVFQECHSLRTNDKFLIPEGYEHQYFNLSDGTAKILFTISPDL